jgi:type VI secretion system secreted protein VgrG
MTSTSVVMSDTITAFAAQRQLSATAVTLSAWDPEQILAPSAQTSSALHAGSLPQLGVYDGAGQRRYSIDPALAGEYATQIAQLRMTALEMPIKTCIGAGSARHMFSGSAFNLTQHDSYDPNNGGDGAFKLLWVEHGAANNLESNAAQLLDSGKAQDAALDPHAPPRACSSLPPHVHNRGPVWPARRWTR